ncbi:uncharacterized protein LOC124436618 [Xenia sp. Carnegie-2017]|uniref:uncharacterized protein LOC124436618 n=1 Tax=Xenia sp. Carnegie-2017 TaxID=2897299 RepID=UPI001F03A823|nr:uncharacterized protein LOC124436618 [Xenia sp. Carnegie-2017]
MEKCLEYLPLKSFHSHGRLILIVFGVFGTIVLCISIGINVDSNSSFYCYNEDISKKEQISLLRKSESDCWRQYKERLTFNYPIFLIVTLNFAIVLLVSLIYGYLVKHRVEKYGQFNLTRNRNHVNEALLPRSGQYNLRLRKIGFRFSTFFIYVVYLVIRLVILSVFVVVLFQIHFPFEYFCSWHPKGKESSSSNYNVSKSYNGTLLDCKNPNGGKSEALMQVVACVNVSVTILTILELFYLLYVAFNDSFFRTEQEFCTVYLLRERKRIRKLLKNIKTSPSFDNVLQVKDDFGEDVESLRNLDEIYVNVVMQTERERKDAYPNTFNRHEIFRFSLKISSSFKQLKGIIDIFMPNDGGKRRSYLRSILIIGRPGIGKTMLTKKLVYEWRNNSKEFWNDKLVLCIQMRAFSNEKVTLKEMLSCCIGVAVKQVEEIYNFTLLYPKKTVLIFDGLDELTVDGCPGNNVQ